MQSLNTSIIHSNSHNPWHNLALEEALLDDVAPNEVILYLWQNEHTVVIGRNQNAWKECRWKELEATGGKLARRLSGGGAVYHDLGNLNFTLIMDKHLFDLHRQLEVILNAVRSLGVEAEFSGRNDILAGGRKFSGNAFHTRAGASYHHGTLLVSVDMNKLTQYLNVSQDKIKSKGVTSVRSRVVNLAELSDEVNIESISKAMEQAFVEVYGGKGETLKPADITADLSSLYDKFSSWEWRFGRSPSFDISFNHRFQWGGVEIGFSLRDGIVEACTIFSDAMDSRLIMEIAARLEQIPFRRESILQKLSTMKTDEAGARVLTELQDWLAQQEI